MVVEDMAFDVGELVSRYEAVWYWLRVLGVLILKYSDAEMGLFISSLSQSIQGLFMGGG